MYYNKYDRERIDPELLMQPVFFENLIWSGSVSFLTTHFIGMTSEDTPSAKMLGIKTLIRLGEYAIGLVLVWTFIAFRNDIDCVICNDPANRDIEENEMVEVIYI